MNAENHPWDLMLSILAAGVVAAPLYAVGVPGGLVIGGTVGASVVALTRNRDVALPRPARSTIQVLLGVIVGSRMTPDVAAELPTYLGPAVLVTLLMMAAGLFLSQWLRRTSNLPSWVLLATCPGALEALVSIAADRGEGPVEVGLFHMVRVVMVVLSIPAILAIAQWGVSN